MLAALALHLCAGLGIVKLELTQELRDRFLPDDPAVASLEREEELFGVGETVVVLVESPTELDARALPRQLRTWSRELAALQGVNGVTTLLDLPTIAWDSPSSWRITTLADSDHPVEAAYRHPIARTSFLRRDRRGALLVLSLDVGADTRAGAQATVMGELEKWIEARPEPYTFTPAGSLPFQMAAIDVAHRDVAVIVAPLATLVLVILSLSFRSFRCAAVIVAVSALNISGTFGLAGLLGWQISHFSLVVAAVILTVGLLDGIHLTYGYCRLRRQDLSADAAIASAMWEVFPPCLWTSLTTMAGFCALQWSSLPQIRQFGALAAVGTAWALLSSFTILPFLLNRFDPRGSLGLVSGVSRLTRLHRPRSVLAITLVALALTAPGLAGLDIRADFPRLFGDRHPITEKLERIEEDWGGIAAVSFLLRLREPHRLGDPEVIERLTDFARLLGQRELVTSVTSPVELLAVGANSFRGAFGRNPTAEEMRAVIEGLRSADLPPAQAKALGTWIHREQELLRVVARVRMMQPERFPAFVRDLHGFEDGLDDLFEVRLTGWPLVYKNMERALLGEILQSFVLAFSAVGVLLLLAVRSLRLWLIALVPNLIPLWLVLGALGLSGAGFSSGLLLAPGVALGLVVDDTIHFVLALRDELSSGSGLDDAISRTLERSGVPLSITSAMLVAGFGALLLSAFRGNQILAVVMIAVAVVAWLADLVLLPVLLGVLERRGTRQ